MLRTRQTNQSVSVGQSRRLGLLVVSGISGVGKSTFIDQLHSNSLPPDLRAQLPTTCESWAQVEGPDVRGMGADSLLRSEWIQSGLILHYEISDIHRNGLGCYELDPALELLSMTNEVCVVMLSAAQEQLIHQLKGRMAKRAHQRGWLREIWRRYGKMPMKDAVGRLKGNRATPRLRMYQDSDWLEECYLSWRAFVSSLAQDNASIKIVSVKPGRRSEDFGTFHFVRPGTIAQ